MAYSRNIDITDPADTDESKYGAKEIREAKEDWKERLLTVFNDLDADPLVSKTLLEISTFDAQSIVAAVLDNTPVAVTVAEQRIVGRITGGNIAALTAAQVLALIFASTVGEDTSIQLPSSLTADGNWVALESMPGTLGETVAFGELVYLKAADSKWWKAKADAIATAGPVMVGYCVIAGDADDSTVIMFRGLIRADALFDAFTLSAPIFISAATAGKSTQTAPSGTTNYIVRVTGHALDANTIHVNISPDYVRLA